jgi:hypothetical protein
MLTSVRDVDTLTDLTIGAEFGGGGGGGGGGGLGLFGPFGVPGCVGVSEHEIARQRTVRRATTLPEKPEGARSD